MEAVEVNQIQFVQQVDSSAEQAVRNALMSVPISAKVLFVNETVFSATEYVCTIYYKI